MNKSKKKQVRRQIKTIHPKRPNRKIVQKQQPKVISNPLFTLVWKALLILSLVFAGVFFCDQKGYFTPDNSNNHTLRKWDSFYELSKQHNVDVLLVGNSHLYTGVNPKNLSAALGCNAFILASPGTNAADHYYALEEAVKISTPKLVVIETYGLKSIHQYELTKGGLSDQFKSFSARRNLLSKLSSMPSLFAVNNYAYAWSNTIRNHDFIFTNHEQIKKNTKAKQETSKKLYLGRYVRWQTGIEDSTMQKYELNGASVDGLNYETNATLDHYVQKIITLCRKKNIRLKFLTLPMFEKHVTNYASWKDKLKASLGDFSDEKHWLDLQVTEDYSGFTKDHFENTTSANQHMTYSGSLLATCKLVGFINESDEIQLPRRKEEKEWRDLFYEEEGFFEYNSPNMNDQNNSIIYTNKKDGVVKEAILIKKKDHYKLIVKVKPNNLGEYKQLKKLRLNLSLNVKNANGQIQTSSIVLPNDMYHSTNELMNYSINLKPLNIVQINNFQFI